MAESTRRSGRATKGQHRGLEDAEPTPPPKKAGGRGRKKQEPDPEEETDAIIRCVCGATTEDEEEEGRAMVCCEECDAWQHNECMEVSTNDDELPEQYYCEQCRPEDHKALLKKMSKGEKPWEERQRQREQEEEEEKRAKKGKGKKGKRGRPSIAKKEEVETNGATTHEGNTVVTEGDTPKDTRVSPDVIPESPQVGTNKRKHQDEPVVNATTPIQVEPASKLRKASSPAIVAKPTVPPPSRRKSSNQTTSKRDSNVAPLQTKLVDRVEDLQNTHRQRVANALAKQFQQSVRQAQKDGSFSLPEGQTESEYALRLALSVEYALYLNFWGTDMQPTEQYRDKFQGINFNIKANTALRNRLLTGELSPNDLSKMTRDDMASKELQEKKAEMIKEAEKQHTLIQEEGPRIRRTHKGEEVVDNETHVTDGTDATFTAPIRRRPSDIDTSMKDASPEPSIAQSPEPVELPERIGEPEPEKKQPLKVDTQASPPATAAPDRKSSSAFNIQDVWSGVKAPDPEQRNRRQSRPSEPPAQPLKQQHDVEIDRLLKDEDQEDEEEYEPEDYSTDPFAPVWHGKVSMQNIAGFSGSGKHAAGANLSASIPWRQLLPSKLTIEGRIPPQKADEYLCGLRYSHTTDLTVVAVTPNDSEKDREAFDVLYEYFTKRERYGVITKNPVSNVKDAYVVPLESGTEKKPEFIELLDDCKIEFPASERMLLLSFVVKMNNSPSAAQQTPHPPEVGALNSPVTATGHQPNPISGHPGFQNSPTPNLPYPPPAQPQYSNYASSPPQGQGYMPPQQQPPYPNPAHYGPTGMEAARQALGEFVNAPTVAELLHEAPNSGIPELTIVKELMERVPASRTDFRMLRGMLTQRLQQQQQNGQQ